MLTGLLGTAEEEEKSSGKTEVAATADVFVDNCMGFDAAVDTCWKTFANIERNVDDDDETAADDDDGGGGGVGGIG